MGWFARVFTALPAFISAYSGQLLSLHLPHSDLPDGRRLHVDVSIHPPPVSVAQAMTAALLSCSSLRSLHISRPTGGRLVAVTLLGHLVAVSVTLLACTLVTCPATRRAPPPGRDTRADRVTDTTLALLLDASPHVQELLIHTHALPYDVLPWVTLGRSATS